jgi:hypothetical protein
MDKAHGDHQPAGSISTWSTLQAFGFQPDEDVFPNDGTAMSIDFGCFKLSAARMLSLMLVDVVAFTGLYRSPRTIASVEFEMPIAVASLEQAAAWITWHLHQQLPGREKALPMQQAAFVLLGLQHLDTLPWVQRTASYEKRPQCLVERSWMRQALRQLGINLKSAEAGDAITITFDGRILMFSGGGWVVPLPAKGDAWVSDFQLLAANLTDLPARLTDENVEISVWDDRLCIGRRFFTGVAPVDKKSKSENRPSVKPAELKS